MEIKAATYSSFASPGRQPVELEQILHASVSKTRAMRLPGC